MHAFFRAAAIALATLASPLAAHEITAGDLQIIHPAIIAPPGMARSAAGYMAIANDGTEPDHLIGIETDAAARAELHETVMEGDIARMQAVPDLEIPAGDTVMLEPGGLHIMMMGLTGPLEPEAMIPATLVFQHAGRVEIEFMVEPAENREQMGGTDHSGH